VFGWRWVNPVMGAALGLWILPRALPLCRQAVRILLQSAPPEIVLGRLRAGIADLDGVIDVHDLHIWTLTFEIEAASAHLMVTTGADPHAVLDQARELLQQRYRVDHATLQLEPADHHGYDEVR
jgi:cobalt-zinc-cadmium efflux system protein